eukprot:751625-Pelagomonas_calceolata.AAC.6
MDTGELSRLAKNYQMKEFWGSSAGQRLQNNCQKTDLRCCAVLAAANDLPTSGVNALHGWGHQGS